MAHRDPPVASPSGVWNRVGRAVGRDPVLAGVTVTYLAVLTAYGVAIGAPPTVPYAVIVAAMVASVAVADARVGFSTVVLVGLSFWGFAHMVGGLVPVDDDRVLYNAVVFRWFHLDNLVHFVGFGFAGAACWEATRAWLPARAGHALGVTVIVCLFGMGVGAANEVFEFAATHLLEATNVGGYENTGRDLVANLLGSLTAGVLVSRRESRPSVE